MTNNGGLGVDLVGVGVGGLTVGTTALPIYLINIFDMGENIVTALYAWVWAAASTDFHENILNLCNKYVFFLKSHTL